MDKRQIFIQCWDKRLRWFQICWNYNILSCEQSIVLERLHLHINSGEAKSISRFTGPTDPLKQAKTFNILYYVIFHGSGPHNINIIFI